MKKISNIGTVFVLIMSLTVSFGLGVSRADTVLFQDNFDAENGGVANASTLNYNSFTNWTVTDGSVDLIGNGYFDFHPGNGLYVDLDGSISDAGVFTTKTSFTFSAGVSYLLTFNLGRSQPYGGDNIVTVLVSIAGQTYTISDSAPLAPYSIAFVDPTNSNTTPIIFSNAGGDNIGAVLDNVKLSQISVPEPGILILLGLSMMSIAGLRRWWK